MYMRKRNIWDINTNSMSGNILLVFLYIKVKENNDEEEKKFINKCNDAGFHTSVIHKSKCCKFSAGELFVKENYRHEHDPYR